VLTRALGDLDRAEDAVQDAYAIALERWPRDGVPADPAAWIVTAARRRAIDRLRSERRFAARAEAIARLDALEREARDEADRDDAADGDLAMSPIADERLRLIFT